MSQINDRRQSKHKPFGFIVATDSFMSGWGAAKGGKSYYAIAVDSLHESDVVEANMRSRSEMKRVRFNLALPKLGPKDHLSVADRHCAQRFFEPGGFAKDASSPRRTSRRASRSAHDGNAIGSLVHKAATKVAKIFTKH